MRALFLALLLANVAFFAWSRYFAAPPPKPAAAVPRETAPEKLKIVPPPRMATPLSQRGTNTGESCLEWGAFTLAAYERAQKALAPLALDGHFVAKRVEEPYGWWVFIPPQPSRQAAVQKAAELKTLGVDDYYVIAEEGRWQWAVSLGLFRSEEAARARLAALRAKGVDSARAGVRSTRLWLQVKGVSAALEAQLRKLARETEGSELRGCA